MKRHDGPAAARQLDAGRACLAGGEGGMIRSPVFVWGLLVAAAVGVLFYTSHQTEELEAELDRLPECH